MTKVCKTCNQEKSVFEFYECGLPDKNGNRYRKGWCKECDRNRLQKWRKEHPIKYRQQHTLSGNKRTQRLKRDEVYRENLLAKKRENSKKNFISGMWSRAKSRAKKCGIAFTIEVKDIVVPEKCPILNVPFVLGTKGNYQLSPSIDRIDPTKGYVPNNIRVISTLANTMKSSASKEQLLTFCINIPQYLSSMI